MATKETTKADKVLELIHTNIHALRLQANYKPTLFEQNLNKTIAEHFKDECKECSDRLIYMNINPQNTKQGFLSGIFGK